MNRMVAETGEIRVDVKLTNALDEALAFREQLSAGDVRTTVADAMVDTGAVRTVLPADSVETLGIRVRRQTTAELADGSTHAVGLTKPILIELMGRETVEEALVLGNEVLIGQTVLEKLDLWADCLHQRWIPNPDHPDQAIT